MPGLGEFSTLVAMAIARLDDISLTIGSVPILRRVELELSEGERLGIAGPNGVGKTTLLMVLASLLPPTGGQGSVLGAALGTPDVLAIRPSIGLSGHDPALYDQLTLAENLDHVARLAGVASGAVDVVLDQVGLAEAADRRAAACSEGMRRRTDLARLLLIRPRLVLLDEAHAGLDADARIIVDEIGRRAVADGGAVVTVTHDADALRSQADRVATMTGGMVRS